MAEEDPRVPVSGHLTYDSVFYLIYASVLKEYIAFIRSNQERTGNAPTETMIDHVFSLSEQMIDSLPRDISQREGRL